jgi:hypothetical protein
VGKAKILKAELRSVLLFLSVQLAASSVRLGPAGKPFLRKPDTPTWRERSRDAAKKILEGGDLGLARIRVRGYILVYGKGIKGTRCFFQFFSSGHIHLASEIDG